MQQMHGNLVNPSKMTVTLTVAIKNLINFFILNHCLIYIIR